MRPLFSCFLILCFGIAATAQNVAITNDGSAADPKAMLDVKASNKGVLLPRITDLGGITGSVPLGLLVFVTDGDRGFYYNASSIPNLPGWRKLTNGNEIFWEYASPNYLFANSAYNVGIGTPAPQAKLHIFGSQGEKLRMENPTPLAADITNEVYFKTGSLFTGGIKTIGTGTNTARLGFFAYAFATTAGLLERMTIADNGNVGIANTNPTEAGLVVDRKVGAVNALFGSNTTGVSLQSAFPGIGLNTYYNNGHKFIDDGAGAYIGFNPTNSRIVFANSTGSGTADAAAALTDKLYIDADGTVSLGSANLAAENLTNAGGYKLKVFGKAVAEEVRVQLKASWPDYVFKNGYRLMPLPQLESFIQQHNHLPNIPAAEKLEKEGTDLGEMQRKMMEKIEELTLYIIELKKELSQQQQAIKGLKKSNHNQP